MKAKEIFLTFLIYKQGKIKKKFMSFFYFNQYTLVIRGGKEGNMAFYIKKTKNGKKEKGKRRRKKNYILLITKMLALFK